MASFSMRYGYKASTLQFMCASATLKNRVFAVFFREEFDTYDTLDWNNYTTGIEDMMTEMGIVYDFPKNTIVKQRNADRLQAFVCDSTEWYVIFDFIERYLAIAQTEKVKRMASAFNRILEEEASGYRVIEKQVVPITSESELATVQQAMSSPFDAPKAHIKKALDLFANRRNPDYENSIKESISAVESMCCIITGLSGANATLGAALKKLKDKGIHIHSAMEKAFLSLYGYASDENGIRHGGMDFKSAPSEDAKYMLVSCSAFVNYLIEKWSKVDQ